VYGDRKSRKCEPVSKPRGRSPSSSPSPKKCRSPSPKKCRSPSPKKCISPSPVKIRCRSPSPVKQRKSNCGNGECNDNRSYCDNTYRICKNNKLSLNVKTPTCLLKDPNYSLLFDKLYKAINENFLDSALAALLKANNPIAGAAAYDSLLNTVVSLFNITLGNATPRLVITEPDGTVVIDTARPPGTNTYANWQNKLINENHNSRVAILTTQLFPCGVGYETKYSSTLSSNQLLPINQAYVAIRAGPFLNNAGTFRLSVNV